MWWCTFLCRFILTAKTCVNMHTSMQTHYYADTCTFLHLERRALAEDRGKVKVRSYLLLAFIFLRNISLHYHTHTHTQQWRVGLRLCIEMCIIQHVFAVTIAVKCDDDAHFYASWILREELGQRIYKQGQSQQQRMNATSTNLVNSQSCKLSNQFLLPLEMPKFSFLFTIPYTDIPVTMMMVMMMVMMLVMTMVMMMVMIMVMIMLPQLGRGRSWRAGWGGSPCHNPRQSTGEKVWWWWWWWSWSWWWWWRWFTVSRSKTINWGKSMIMMTMMMVIVTMMMMTMVMIMKVVHGVTIQDDQLGKCFIVLKQFDMYFLFYILYFIIWYVFPIWCLIGTQVLPLEASSILKSIYHLISAVAIMQIKQDLIWFWP